MADLLNEAFQLLKGTLGSTALLAVALCGSLLFNWFQHLRLRLQRERTDFEKEKHDEFLKAAREAKTTSTERPPAGFELGERVLVVDDEPTMVEILKHFLTRVYPNVDVQTASNGAEALEKVKAATPSILVTDIFMPHDGISLIKTLQKEGVRIPTLVVSGYAGQESFKKLLKEKGVSEDEGILFLSKPFRFRDLEDALDRLRKRKC